jgi:MinD-like ATPase involved in chromosome partitioning or flagellar assembly
LSRPGAGDDDSRIDNAFALALSRLCGPLARLRGVPEPYSLLITSTQNDGGARTEAVDRIVMAAADRGITVLLVEADLGMARGKAMGFLDVLRGDCSLATVTLASGASAIKRLNVGSARQGQLDEMREAALDKFLKEAGHYFDLIIFDGGAFEQNPRIAPLVGKVDDIVFIAVQGATRQSAALTISTAVSAASGQPISASMMFQAL